MSLNTFALNLSPIADAHQQMAVRLSFFLPTKSDLYCLLPDSQVPLDDYNTSLHKNYE